MERGTPSFLRSLALLFGVSLPLSHCARPEQHPLPPYEETLGEFDVDPAEPLDLQEVGAERRDGVAVHDVSYASPKGGRVPAYVVVPEGEGPFAGLIFLHGMSGNRGRMLAEAVELSRLGAVALLIDAPMARHGRPANRRLTFTEKDRDEQIQLIVDLRRGVDLLLARGDVDPRRLGFLGHSYGASMGGLLAGVEKRLRTYVLTVGDGGLVAHFTGKGPSARYLQQVSRERQERWRAAMEPIEPIRFVGHAAPASLFFQFGRWDGLVPRKDAARFHQAASEPKRIRWYNAGHGLNRSAARDRRAWLEEQIGLGAAVIPGTR